MVTEKQEEDTILFRTLEVEIDDAYRRIASAQDSITSSLDMDDYDECFSAVTAIMVDVHTIRDARAIADKLDIDWDTL